MANKFDRLFLGKEQVTKGTDPVPTAALNAIRVESFEISVDTSEITNEAVKETMGELPHEVGKQATKCTVTWKVSGSGAAGTAPESRPLFLATGHLETIVASTSVAYDYTSDESSLKYSTFYCYKNGLLWKMVDAVGTLSESYEIDGFIVYTAELSAPYIAPTVVAVPAGAAYQGTQPLVFSSASVVNDGGVVNVGSLSIEDGGSIAEHYTTGEHQFEIANRQPSVTISKNAVATAAEWTSLTSGTTSTLSSTSGATAGNIITISAPLMKRNNVAYGERDERDLHEVTWKLYESTGDDQRQILFT